MRRHSYLPNPIHDEGRNTYSRSIVNRKRGHLGRIAKYDAVPKERLEAQKTIIDNQKKLMVESHAIMAVRNAEADSKGDYETSARCRDLLELIRKERRRLRWHRGEWDKSNLKALESLEGKTQAEIDAINNVKAPYQIVCAGYQAEESARSYTTNA